ncbi:MAG: malate dehydrogenase [Verrucomicrobia bacterium RIFCSPHIGHO2_12_FULL_41_10]|nr:MAG: malate dehydrogenase [Verrucomicrobia bacterium RIFCSPHIGHO2_12_FULL_41_10]HLB34544.1 malate dehydrogenase [Chthoniobacterales bacterium]
MKSPIVVSLTGAAGQIGYSILPRIASGALFGPDQPIALRLIEIEPGMKALEGVVMELHDSAFPLLHSVDITSNLDTGFQGANWAFLVGSVPRKAGMERKDLLGINGKIFVGQGQAIAANAASDVRILVVGNPANTNCLIAMNNAPEIPADRWHAMTRLDEDRARNVLAEKAACHSRDVKKVAIWGNHSSTLYPDFEHAIIAGEPAPKVINDPAWFEGEFIKNIQQRGAAILAARGLSSALSAANAAIETVRSLREVTPVNDWHSVAIPSDGSYGIDQGLVFSFPTRSDGHKLSIVEDLSLGAFAKAKIEATLQELREEKAMVADLL